MREKRETKANEISIDEALVRNVTALVETTADLICADGEDVLDVQAKLFALLEKKCAEKKKMRKALAVTKPVKRER